MRRSVSVFDCPIYDTRKYGSRDPPRSGVKVDGVGDLLHGTITAAVMREQ